MRHLVGCEAIVQLDHTNLIAALARSKSGILEDLIGADLGHFVTYDVHGTSSLKGAGSISGKSLSDDLNGLVFKTMRMNEVFGSHNAACCSILKALSVTCNVT